MMKKALVIVLSLIFIISCNKKDDNIQNDYLNQIENEYNQNTGSNVVLETDNTTVEDTGILTDNQYSDMTMSNDIYTQTPMQPANTYTTTKPNAYAMPGPRKATVNNFYSPWADTHKTDPLIIQEIRVMIANKEYVQAKNYIDRLDFNNLPANVDLGQLYQFKGIVHYFLSKSDKSNIAIANDSFKMVAASTKIEKFKPLSLLWNGMLYQTYSNDPNELQNAVSLFDNIINSYPRTRFANDAIFYKALTLKKMGRPANEYNDLLLSVKRGGFADTLVFSQKVNDYVPANRLVDEQMVQY
ncbi:tol-pal system YbgF family protein [Brachyspira pilosicoli]|uniref:tetratricopeptide repeat protein n=1 Tax=Brachyspira pilosicoli TaxID=52584 RepID=UPI001CA54712|nr:hypothetical protein [Brachyspira pilosicoli]MBW5396797.1 hypothetical protein [Brachyspira pilosicoli]